MNRNTIWLAVLVIGLAAAGCAPEYSSYRYRAHRAVRDSTQLMTKDDVIALTKARIGDNVIIDMIRRSGSTFVLRTPDVIALADSGVSDTVISAMMKSDEPWGGGEAPARYYSAYSPYYYDWWAAYPWWSPWYYSSWYGWWGGYYRPHYYYHGYAPYYGGVRYRSSGAAVSRPMGRRR